MQCISGAKNQIAGRLFRTMGKECTRQALQNADESSFACPLNSSFTMTKCQTASLIFQTSLVFVVQVELIRIVVNHLDWTIAS